MKSYHSWTSYSIKLFFCVIEFKSKHETMSTQVFNPTTIIWIEIVISIYVHLSRKRTTISSIGSNAYYIKLYIYEQNVLCIHYRYHVASYVTYKTINNEPEWNRDNYAQGISRRYKHLRTVYYEIHRDLYFILLRAYRKSQS